MNSKALNPPLLCNMDVFTSVEREDHIQSASQLYQSVQNVHEVENGYEFTFPNESEVIAGLGKIIFNERRCCPFLEFTLKISSNNAAISLLLTGPDGTQEFLRAEFAEAFL